MRTVRRTSRLDSNSPVESGLDVTENFAASTLGLLKLSPGHADRAVMHLTDCVPHRTGVLLPTSLNGPQTLSRHRSRAARRGMRSAR
jgi:hypothetical protein